MLLANRGTLHQVLIPLGGHGGSRVTPYTPQHVANFFLDRAEEEGFPLTQLKLMKLVYIAYGWHLAITGEALFG